MCIFNLTPSKKINRIIQQFNLNITTPPSLFGVFVLSESIQQVIHIKHKYVLISMCIDLIPSSVQVLDSMDQLTVDNISMALARFEEAAYEKKDKI